MVGGVRPHQATPTCHKLTDHLYMCMPPQTLPHNPFWTTNACPALIPLGHSELKLSLKASHPFLTGLLFNYCQSLEPDTLRPFQIKAYMYNCSLIASHPILAGLLFLIIVPCHVEVC